MQKFSTLLLTLLLVLLSQWARSQSGTTLTLSANSLAGFTTALGTPSAQQSVRVSGTGLTGNVTATASAGFEVSWTSGASFSSSIVLTQSGGLVTNVPLYVRLIGAALGPISGTVTVASTGAAPQSVALTGTVTAAPTPNPTAIFTNMSPNAGLGGSTVLLTFYGSNFVPGATVNSQIAYGVVTATYVSSTQLTALITLPSVSNKTVTYFNVANPPPGGGGSAPQMVFFTVNPGPPTITSFSPTSGPVGTSVTITGTNLAPSSSSSYIFFNGTQAAPFPRVPNPTEIYALVPPGATTGLISVTNANGAAVSATPFTVTASPPDFFENFEAGTKSSYAAASVALTSGGWTLGESLIGTTAGADKFNGAKSARLRGGGFLEMDTDKPNGAGVVTVSAASYSTESGASFLPEISTDGGVTYTSLLGSSPAPVLTATLTPYSFTANRSGNVRLRFSSTNQTAATNPRLNLDDIGITSYSATAVRPTQALPDLQVYPVPAQHYLRVLLPQNGPIQAALLDLTGRQVLPPTLLPANRQLALPVSLPAGLYLLRVSSQGQQRTIRIVKD